MRHRRTPEPTLPKSPPCLLGYRITCCDCRTYSVKNAQRSCEVRKWRQTAFLRFSFFFFFFFFFFSFSFFFFLKGSQDNLVVFVAHGITCEMSSSIILPCTVHDELVLVANPGFQPY